jgi:hypothetical protein
MGKIADISPTAELSPEMIKTICDAISQEFYRWELNEDDSDYLSRSYKTSGQKPLSGTGVKL